MQLSLLLRPISHTGEMEAKTMPAKRLKSNDLFQLKIPLALRIRTVPCVRNVDTPSVVVRTAPMSRRARSKPHCSRAMAERGCTAIDRSPCTTDKRNVRDRAAATSPDMHAVGVTMALPFDRPGSGVPAAERIAPSTHPRPAREPPSPRHDARCHPDQCSRSGAPRGWSAAARKARQHPQRRRRVASPLRGPAARPRQATDRPPHPVAAVRRQADSARIRPTATASRRPRRAGERSAAGRGRRVIASSAPAP